ncbi:Alpha-1,3-mannosyltransferase-like protein [Linnemannia exigua]|uniref:Alpha-1,3/1,6-mannosyltransferase ALG2 n=1 Tax=Linnemannia exigua TaxID=604196 RepID=A0AAD4DCZ3_9FUNG|nr:Alpha-1,3-mannosyltransferase-like protein [Linnemannia exigua]
MASSGLTSPSEEPFTPMRIAFIHPDLGIGGAERLVVDAAVGLQELGHKVTMYTSHHDPSHCFEETRDGTLSVKIGGNTIVPRTFVGRFYIICAIFRNLHLALIMILLNRKLDGKEKFDIIIVDQLSVSIPLLRLTGAKIFFYCHFPDKLLTKRESLLKKLYRLPVDFIEELTTGMADTIVVNSKFTANIFQQSFQRLHQVPEVLYPSIQFDKFDRTVDLSLPEVQVLKVDNNTISFLSINRYERKKDINLAIHAFARLLKDTSAKDRKLRLIIAGGYDTRVTENVEHHQELVELAEAKYGLRTFTLSSGQTDRAVPADTQVLFLQSISDVQKLFLLQTARALLYTPTNEHFGIVPVESMYMKCPVVAVNSGGPTESVLHGKTGYLCEPEVTTWAETLKTLLEKSDQEVKDMGQAGHDRVVSLFSLKAFVSKLNGILVQLQQGGGSSLETYGMFGSVHPIAIFSVIALALSIMVLYAK